MNDRASMLLLGISMALILHCHLRLAELRHRIDMIVMVQRSQDSRIDDLASRKQ